MSLTIRSTSIFVAAGALSCASTALANVGAAGSDQALEASGGLTLGSAALVALAGVIAAFGRTTDGEPLESTATTEIDGLRGTALPEEFSPGGVQQ